MVVRSASGAARQLKRSRARLLLERLEPRCLLTIYTPVGVTLAPSPVEGTAFAGAVVGTFASADPLAGLSATINWGPTATPTSSVGTINLIGSVFVPGVGPAPQYSVTGGTTYPEETQSASQPITVTVSDAADSTNGIIVSSTTVSDAPMTTTGGIASASVTEGANVNFTGAIALMTFTDGNPNSTPAEFSASISWGDGSPSSAGTITQGGATYTVSGTHAYADETTGTPRTILVTVTDVGGQTATHTSSLTVTDAALNGPTAIPVTAAEGQSLANVPLGTFLDGNPLGNVSDFTVSINWGDGITNDPGTVTLVGGTASNAKFVVSGSHTYSSAAGSPYAVTVSVTDKGGSTTTINTAATVTQTPLSVSVGSINAVASSPTASQVVGTFFDAGGADPLASYSATVNWGDGTSNTTATGVTIAAVAGQPGMFTVTAPSHTYAVPGLYPLTVTVNDSDPTSGSGGGFALVSASALTAVTAPAGPIAGAVEGQPLPASTQLASFTVQDPAATAAGFTALVDWGDGSPQTTATITTTSSNPTSTTFSVTGGHTYAEEAAAGYTVTVHITDAFNNTVSATTAVSSVADAPLTTGTALPVLAAVHQPLNSVPIATFVDTNPGATSADFTATINWGDGSLPDPNAYVVLVGGNASGTVFAVYGSHTFNTAGTYSISVTVNDKGNQSLTITPASANAAVSQSSLSVNVLPQTTSAGTAIPAGTVIGSFNDALGADPIGQYSASIDWGDGSPADAAVTIVSLGGSSFSVASTAGHTYASSGTYALKLTVSDPPVSGIGGNLVVVSGSVATAPVITPGAPIIGVEGTPLVGVTVATFADSGAGVTVSNFFATIDWGDGSPESAGFVSAGVGPGNFIIKGNHTYAEEGGPYTVTVWLTDSANNHVATTTTATIADAALSGASGLPVTASEDVPLVNASLGTFIDANKGATPADFAATIDWGDGSPVSAGFVSLVGGSASGAVFSVSGTHVYLTPGPFTVTATVADAGGSTTAITTQATVKPSLVTAAPGVPIVATEGIATTANQIIARFTDGGNIDSVTNYTATIDWGDGSATTAGTIVDNGSGYNVLAPAHTYAEEGTFVVHVTITDTDSPLTSALAANFAVVKDATLSAISAGHVSGTEGIPLSGVTVASFSDANPAGTTDEFTATISWGDGATTNGTVTQPTGAGTAFVVSGSHTYADSLVNGTTGHFPITVVVKDAGGQRLKLANTADVADVAISLFAILDSRSDHGVSNTDGITNDNRPDFLGGSEPNSTIILSVTSASGTQLVGAAVTDASGMFSVGTGIPLTDGVYTVHVAATDASGHTTAAYILPQQLVIDTVGPKVTGVQFDRVNGRIFVTFADDRSGLDQSTLIDGSNYKFGKYPPAASNRKSPYFVTSLVPSPATQPTDPQTVTVSINNGRYLPGGRYLLTIASAGGAGTLAHNGLRDAAGNALDGEFYGFFPSGNNKTGGDFVAGLDAIHRTIFAPVPARNGYATPVNPPGTLGAGKKIPVVIPPKSAAKVATAKVTLAGPIQAFVKAAKPHAARASTKPVKGLAH
jgi:large repetitive protein